ncbi:MAG: replication-relaxation family protein [Pelolinea sp.]|nr:replication-relaxation family protein [Pelolinea sp.]
MNEKELKEKKQQGKLRFQERDGAILKTIYNHDGVVARRHIKYLFWKDKSWRGMARRLSFLKSQDYIQWPSLEQRKSHPIPEPVVWLGWRGALYLAGISGLQVEEPKNANENQLRNLERQLRSRGFYWMREPRWSNLRHDLSVTDIRFWVQTSLLKIPHLVFEEWINESVFRIQTDYVDYKVQSREGEWVLKHKGVIPDGYFSIIDQSRKEKGEPFRARFLLEVDMATHDNPSFGIEKSAPGGAYIKSQPYRERFESNSGRWLVVTTGSIRMRNLLIQTRSRAGIDAHLFYFTTFDQMARSNFFLDPVWRQPTSSETIPLVSG